MLLKSIPIAFSLLLAAGGCAVAAPARPAQVPQLEARLSEIAARSDGRLGFCAVDESGAEACVNGDARFSLQSVMKLIVGAAAMDAVDRKGWRLDDEVIVRRENLSLHVQPLADLVARDGEVRTTIGDLIERAVTQSDSAATDILFEKLGGSPAIREFLARNQASEGIRLDRDERHLQTETSGVTWRPEFVDPAELARARAQLTPGQREAAFAAYLKDPRDTATPRAMARFLARLSAGHVLSEASTTQFLGVMQRTRTFPGRLRAGAPADWRVAHKTGTSADLNGLNAVTNDVGLMIAPDTHVIAVAAFLAESRQPASERDALIAASARAVADGYLASASKP